MSVSQLVSKTGEEVRGEGVRRRGVRPEHLLPSDFSGYASVEGAGVLWVVKGCQGVSRGARECPGV